MIKEKGETVEDLRKKVRRREVFYSCDIQSYLQYEAKMIKESVGGRGSESDEV